MVWKEGGRAGPQDSVRPQLVQVMDNQLVTGPVRKGLLPLVGSRAKFVELFEGAPDYPGRGIILGKEEY